MSHTPHELHDEFPDAGQILHDLKMSNAHFVKLADQYHEVNREIHRIESGVEAASDERAETLKKSRLHLVDEIAVIIGKAKEKA